MKSELAVVLGSTPFELDGDREGLRVRETNLGDFLADALRWTASQELGREIDVGLINRGGIRASMTPTTLSGRLRKLSHPSCSDSTTRRSPAIW